MENIISDLLLKIVLISIVFSTFEMALVQKLKKVFPFKKKWSVLILNFVSSFLFGTIFSMWFFSLNIYNSLWVSFFTFLGAPSIYETLRKQNITSYTPESLTEIRKKTK